VLEIVQRPDNVVVDSRGEFRHCHSEMQHGCSAEVHFEIASNGAFDSGRCRHLRDLHGIQNATILARIDADEVTRIRANSLHRVLASKDGFVEHEWNVGALPQTMAAAEVATSQRLLKRIHSEALEGRERTHGIRLRPPRVRVHG